MENANIDQQKTKKKHVPVLTITDITLNSMNIDKSHES